uniref:Uncharacterized protein n=1 Tax=Ananas comosus var. bracteatus TaxID=296719 RepID=A0A6V7PRX0_ANACO|nr:unnamed protein product [Ananas comosus var. bracteatus]
MFEFPDRVLCRADAFYVGRPFPILSFDDALLPGHTYFVLPLDRLRPPSAVVTVASLASLSPAGLPVEFAGAQCRPFEYVRGTTAGWRSRWCRSLSRESSPQADKKEAIVGMRRQQQRHLCAARRSCRSTTRSWSGWPGSGRGRRSSRRLRKSRTALFFLKTKRTENTFSDRKLDSFR